MKRHLVTDGRDICEMNARELRACLIVLMFALLVTVHIQLFAVFHISTDVPEAEESSETGCYRDVEVTLTRNKTPEDVLAEWRSLSAGDGRLLAVPRNRKNYMAVGCVLTGPTTTATTTTTTVDLLAQLVNYTSLYHKLQMVVIVVILNDVDPSSADEFVDTVTTKYFNEVNIGFIHVLQQRREKSSESGPVSRQVKAMLLMSDYVASISTYYLHLGSSDVTVSRDYADSVREFVRRETRRRRQRATVWTVLQFSMASTANDDFLGYFLHAADLVRFATFFLRFDRHNCTSMLQQTFLDVVTQRVSLCRRPPVFRHKGDSVEDDVKKPWPSADDPPATVLSSMRPVGTHTVDLAYSSDGGYFRCSSVTAGDWISVVFETEVMVERIRLRTGLPDGSLTLRAGFIELSPRLLKLDTTVPNVVCADFVRIGEIVRESTELDNVAQLVWGRPTRCLRLTVGELGESDGDDVVFHQIAIFT